MRIGSSCRRFFGGLWVSGAAPGAGDPPLQILVLPVGFLGSRSRLGLWRDRWMIESKLPSLRGRRYSWGWQPNVPPRQPLRLHLKTAGACRFPRWLLSAVTHPLSSHTPPTSKFKGFSGSILQTLLLVLSSLGQNTPSETQRPGKDSQSPTTSSFCSSTRGKRIPHEEGFG